ncbi:MAG TPA: DsbA family protein [Azospirillaceae bacterium]|nr:DsbA family protein [Azospirillaceae bacterium]HRQ81343.1 DsbA family protein [Azospirillaceae bacterium]
MPFTPVAFRRFAAAALSLAALPFYTAPAAAGVDEGDRPAIERIVREYLIANPEVLVEAMQALEQRQQTAADQKARAALKQNRQQIFNDDASPVGGNPKGDVTVVEFFDYNCGYCKAVHDDALKLVKDDGRLRYVYKEFPILGPGSVVAAKAALAARAQGKYVEAHNALMSHRGRLDEAAVLRILGDAGLDVTKLKADMEAPAVAKAIESNLLLADKLGIRGTPAFIIGDELAPGAIKLDEMKRMVAEARKK